MKPSSFVPLAFGVLRLRRIGARVSHTDETGSEDALVLALDRAGARLSFAGSAPLANEDSDSSEAICRGCCC